MKKISLKKQIAIWLVAICSLMPTLLSPLSVFADGNNSGWGALLKKAAETTLVVRLFKDCYNQATNEYRIADPAQALAQEGYFASAAPNAQYVTTGWSLFQENSKKAKDTGAWLENIIFGGQYGDGQVYCRESSKETYKDGNGSEIVRLLSKYLLGDSEIDTLRYKLFCNKDDGKRWGLTMPVLTDDGSVASDCSDYSPNIRHYLIIGGSKEYSSMHGSGSYGGTYKYGIEYVKELYNAKRKDNAFLPAWDDIDSAIKSDNALRYFMFYNDLASENCMTNSVTSGGNLMKKVNLQDGSITEERYAKRTNDDYDGKNANGWDYRFDNAIVGKGSGTVTCQTEAPAMNELADAAAKAIKAKNGQKNSYAYETQAMDCITSSKGVIDQIKEEYGIDYLNSNRNKNKAGDAVRSLLSRAWYDVMSLQEGYSISRNGLLTNLFYNSDGSIKKSTAREEFEDLTTNFNYPFYFEKTSENIQKEELETLVDTIDAYREQIRNVISSGTSDYLTEAEKARIDNYIAAYYQDVFAYVNSMGEFLGGTIITEEDGTYKREEVSSKNSALGIVNEYDGYVNYAQEKLFDIYETLEGEDYDFYPENLNDSTVKKVVNIDTSLAIYNEENNADKTNDDICPFWKNINSALNGKLNIGNIKPTFDKNNTAWAEIPEGIFGDDDIIRGNTVSTCENSGALGWILCPVVKGLSSAAASVYEGTIAMELEIESDELSTEGNGSGVYQAWKVAVGFANTILVILFIIVIFSQLTGYGIDNYGIKRILPKLIVMAILINLSFFICQIAVDISNIVGAGIKGLLDMPIQDAAIHSGNTTALENALGEILKYVGIGLAAGGVIKAVTVVKEGGWASVGSALIMAFIIVLLCLVAVIFFFVILIIRKVAVLALVILSPLAFACYTLPNTKKLFTKWFDGFKRLLLVYPICGFVIGLSLLLCRVINSTGSSMLQSITCIIILAYPYFFIPKLVSKALDSVTSIGSLVSGVSRGLRKGAKSGILNSRPVKDLKERADSNRKSAEAQRSRERNERLAKSYEKAAIKAQERAGKQRSGLFAGIRQNAAERRAEQASLRSMSATEEALKSQSQLKAAEAQADYTKKYGSYTDKALTAQARISENEFNKRAATAENPPIKVEIEMARSQAAARVSSEQERAFADQFAGMDKKELQTSLQKTLAELSSRDPAINKQEASLEKAQALKELLKKQDATEELLQSVGTLKDTAIERILSGDPENAKFLIETMANSGSVIGKGYSKYLGDIRSRRSSLAGDIAKVDADASLTEAEKTQKKADLERRAMAPALSLKDWMSQGDTEEQRKNSELRSLDNYLNYTYGSSASLGKMSKDDLKFLKSEDAAAARAKLFEEQPKAFKDAILGKIGEEKRLAGDILSGQLNAAYQAGGVADYAKKISELDLAANDLSQLNMDNIRSLAGIQTSDDPDAGAKMEALKKALATQIATAAGDDRIRHKIPPEIQNLLGFPPEKGRATGGNSGDSQPPVNPSGSGGGGPFANVGKNNSFSNRGGSGPSASPSL